MELEAEISPEKGDGWISPNEFGFSTALSEAEDATFLKLAVTWSLTIQIPPGTQLAVY